MNENYKIFLLNKCDDYEYQRWIKRYIKLVEGCENKDFSSFKMFNNHHIVPASWKREFKKNKNNLIRIPTVYHVVMHQMLARTNDKRMIHAFQKIVGRCQDDLIEYFNYNVGLRIVTESIERERQSRYKPIVNLNTGEVFESIVLAAEKCNTRPENIHCALRKGCKSCGFYWQYKDVVDKTSIDCELQKRIEDVNLRERLRVDKRGKKVVNLTTGQEFDNLRQAFETLKLQDQIRGPVAISTAISQQSACCGYYWQYKDVVEKSSIEQELTKYTEKCTLVPVYNLNTQQRYASYREAGRNYNTSDSNIREACTQKNKATGCYWITEKEYNASGLTLKQLLQKYIANTDYLATHKKRRKVINLNTKQIFPNGMQAGAAFGLTKSAVTTAIRLNRKAAGSKWMYYDDYLKLQEQI